MIPHILQGESYDKTWRNSIRKGRKNSVEKAAGLYRGKYCGFGPAPAQETLFERDGIEISVSTLRRALLASGLWKQKKEGGEYRSRRTPRARFGELVQFDGSHHG
jgi:hypothetical protein